MKFIVDDPVKEKQERTLKFRLEEGQYRESIVIKVYDGDTWWVIGSIGEDGLQ